MTEGGDRRCAYCDSTAIFDYRHDGDPRLPYRWCRHCGGWEYALAGFRADGGRPPDPPPPGGGAYGPPWAAQ